MASSGLPEPAHGTTTQIKFKPRRNGIFGGAGLLTSRLEDARPPKFKMMSLLTELEIPQMLVFYKYKCTSPNGL